MKIIKNILKKIDAFQQNRRFPAFAYAVIKKYGEDQAGYQAALLTYYGFLALFPLLLVVTTLTAIFAQHHPDIQDKVITSVTDYFPVLGTQLSAHVQTLHKSGLALIIGLLFTLYGARGVADAFRQGVNTIWRVPKSKQPGFPKSVIKSLALILVGGAGFIVAAACASLAGGFGHGLLFRLLSAAVNLFVLFWLFFFLLNMCLPKHAELKQVRSGAITAAVGLVILQAAGGYILARELKNLDALYSYFALSLGLLFWIYLQAQVLYYAVEVTSVRAKRLWPRSLTGNPPTKADLKLKEK